MNKFDYGNYDSTKQASVFTVAKGYNETDGDTTTRKQFSQPLVEVKDFLNKIITVLSDGNTVVQLRINEDGLIQYRLSESDDWVDTAAGGHQIFDDAGHQMPQKTKLMFLNTNVRNEGEYTVVEGVQGEAGVSVSSMVQIGESHESGGINTWRATLSNGQIFDFVVTNGAKGDTGEKGEDGRGLIILGTYATLEELQAAHPVGNEGDIYSVGTSIEANPIYVWDVDNNAWEYQGKIRGEKGAKGDTGATGATGTGIASIVETQHSEASGGINIWTVTLTNGAVNTFQVKNGEQGAAGEGMKTGGTAGQVLKKRTNLDYDTEWDDLPPEPTVDQTYDPTSSNAQSGKAVKQALDNTKTLNGHSILDSGDIRDFGERRTRRNITSDLSNLCTAIAEQNLEKYGYAIGDYFVGASGYYYYLADMDTNYGGYNNQAVVSTHHCGIVVDTKSTSQWLSSGNVSSYSASTLHAFLSGTALTNIKNDITALFGGWSNHLLARTEIDNGVGGWGTTWTGLANCLICAMTEVQMYGARVFGESGFQTGTGSKQLELFRKFRFSEIYGNISIWLKSVYSASGACDASYSGLASLNGLTYSLRASGLILFH